MLQQSAPVSQNADMKLLVVWLTLNFLERTLRNWSSVYDTASQGMVLKYSCNSIEGKQGKNRFTQGTLVAFKTPASCFGTAGTAGYASGWILI
jgi:hypothetical protein